MCTFYISKTEKFAIYGKKNSWKSKFCKNWPTLLRKKTGEFEVEKTWFLNSPSKKCIKVTGVMPKSMLPCILKWEFRNPATTKMGLIQTKVYN